jgi:hypothetical protein
MITGQNELPNFPGDISMPNVKNNPEASQKQGVKFATSS